MKHLLIVLVAFLTLQTYSQKKYKIFSFLNDKRIVKYAETEKVEFELVFKKPEAKIEKNLFLSSFLTLALSKALDLVANTIYNPKNFIYATQTKHNFFESDEVQDLFYAKRMIYRKFDDDKKSLLINFSLKPLEVKSNYFLKLNIDNLIIYNTRSKITSKKDKINIIIDIEYEYFDKLGERKTYKLNPFQIDNIKPNTKEEIVIPKLENYWILPNSIFYNSIIIKVTEVNADKKKMDKWRKILYENNKETIETKLIENITKKSSE